jgi:16S rRNA (adenine1518-N6/adenine1519-N6)-dimethyltransferase
MSDADPPRAGAPRAASPEGEGDADRGDEQVAEADRGGQHAPVADARGLLARYGLRAKKSWGQNFLIDRRVQERIVAAAALGPADVVVEIGPGLGALTDHLVRAAGRVLAVERDPDMVEVLRERFGARLDLRPADALAFDFEQDAARASRPLVVVGNLPYQITSPLLFRIIEAGAGTVSRAVVMVQREVAERMAARPGSKTYGRLSVMVQQAASVQLLFHVGRHAFTPQPQVVSTVLRLDPRPRPLAPVQDAGTFAAVVRLGFAGRRKMLRRSLGDPFGAEVAAEALAAADVRGTRRAEELAVAEFGRLADALWERRLRWSGDPRAKADPGTDLR